MHVATKSIFIALAIVVTFPCAVCSNLEKRLGGGRELCFLFWAHVLSLTPGLVGSYLRRAYYFQTIKSCSLDCNLGFGAIVVHRDAVIEPQVNVGDAVRVGTVWLKCGSLVGSGTSLLSGGHQHSLDGQQQWTPCSRESRTRIVIGPNAWLGEHCVVMCDVGCSTMVCAGSVVTARIPDHIMVAGNPARFVKRLDVCDDVVRREDGDTQHVGVGEIVK